MFVVLWPLIKIVLRLTVKYVCLRGVMDVVFSVCILTRGAVGVRIWEV